MRNDQGEKIMEQQNNSKSTKVMSTVISLLVIAAAVFLGSKLLCGDLFGNKSIDAAEKYVNHQVYSSLGLPCDSYKSDVIYSDGNTQLIAVKFYISGSDYVSGSYCVYCNRGYVVSSTKMMAAEYPYKSNIESLKAMFGI